ncbi:E3 ubiquitin ligase PQT3-like [Cornus florida]|uniref:E3 ubiquitin ligase PQT3-like n=1 Tax=Cornus florida TaxID=4283 RepID=UPI0028A2BA62|nr:E3 ubiquitin ligase PQT3-like [Cornus florida]XP_059662040.1 E3 ubiquitin ligase PQT3-like [Cornus florida]
MSIRFKFRSSASFDSVDIEGRSSISVRDLRSKIVRQKKLNISQDLDLVFSDATTGQEYNDENFQISSGSSVIIKRVPSGSVPAVRAPFNSAENLGIKDSNHANPIGYIPVNAEMDNFDDFGVDLCPVPEAGLSDSDLEFEKNTISNEKAKNAATRLGCQKLEISDLSEAVPGGCNRCGTEENIPQTKPKIEDHIKLEKNQRVVNDAKCPAVQNYDLPSELKCSLCNTFFKEAVMIPCCQHSFCEKCIRAVLLEKARCPKCSSSKCRVENLLPNLSLRQAIEHFLESQILIGDPDNAFQKYAPDGESGIQAKNASCAVTIFRREPDLPLSPSATEKGSNQIMAESVYQSLHRDNTSFVGSGSRTNNLGAGKALKSAYLSQQVKQLDGERIGISHRADFRSAHEDLTAVLDFQGENQPVNLPQTRVHEEADSTFKKMRGVWVNNGGGDRSYTATGRHKKGDRTCYMCGSPDHFIRDCPAASSPHPTLQTGNTIFPGAMPGFASPYWNGTPFTPFRPFTNMYGNPGFMPYNATMVPVTPYAIPSYMPPMYGGMPVPSGFLRMGGAAPPVGTSAERPLSRSELLELRDCENKRKLSNDSLLRGQYHDDEDNDSDNRYEPGRSNEYKSHIGREKSASYSEDSFTKRSQRKYRHDIHLDRDTHSFDERHEKKARSSIAGRDRRPYHPERSSSGVEDMPHSSDRGSEEKYKHHHRSSKKHERRGHCTGDSSRSRHQTKKEKDMENRNVESDVKGANRKRHGHSESGLEPSSSGDQKKHRREKHFGYGSRHSRHSSKPHGDVLCNDRWQMVGGSGEDSEEGYRHHKRKRVH